MKAHTARWYEDGESRWALKQRGRDGGAVLAWIEQRAPRVYFWHIDAWFEQAASLYAAQRQVRKALAEEKAH